MTSPITRHKLTRWGAFALDDADNQSRRKHPERRDSGYDAQNLARKGREMMMTVDVIPRNATPPGPRTRFVLEDTMIKVIGWNVGPHAATTGTSGVGSIVATSNMSVCIAVALGGVPTPEAAEARSDTDPKVRMFHIFPYNDEALADIRAAIEKMRSRGFDVTAAMAGGMVGDIPGVARSEAMVGAIQQLLRDMGVRFEDFSPDRANADAGQPRPPLAAIVASPDQVVFTNDLRVIERVPDPPPGFAPR